MLTYQRSYHIVCNGWPEVDDKSGMYHNTSI
jgi:hypothetical protein